MNIPLIGGTVAASFPLYAENWPIGGTVVVSLWFLNKFEYIQRMGSAMFFPLKSETCCHTATNSTVKVVIFAAKSETCRHSATSLEGGRL